MWKVETFVPIQLSVRDRIFEREHSATCCNKVCCSVLQCVAVCCSVLQQSMFPHEILSWTDFVFLSHVADCMCVCVCVYVSVCVGVCV